MQTLTRSLELRHQNGDGGPPIIAGYAIKWGEWATIDSKREGRFLESFAPHALDDSLLRYRSLVKVLFQHGQDPQLGLKPLGTIELLLDDGHGLRYEVALLNARYVWDLVPGIESGLYGASVSFRTSREDFNPSPGRSSFNPEGLPQRVILEARLFEFSIVTWPAYKGATAGLRGFAARWFLRRGRITTMPLPRVVAQRSQPWRLGPEPWRLGVKR